MKVIGNDDELEDTYEEFNKLGRPAPSVEWFDNNGQLITVSEKYKIENTALNTVLTIKNICVRDRGEYKLRIRNRCGEDAFSISIQCLYISELVVFRQFPLLPPPQLATIQEKKTRENSRRHSIGALKKMRFRE
ncbi:immunoglobulin I-set domain protein [Ancylostoma duodenale]|uniref:Immunoglobulin I-set domain protein n=1 Tax=Ancylostoma duodenale TaxID=51022 RepID=A0A0C2GA21_9BILA|nr:immunoglobulin I-set domain protein [Ancylostoma duodenale]